MDNHEIYRHSDRLENYRKFIGKFLQMADIRYFDKGELIDSPQGEPMKALHLVVDGTIECSYISPTGQKKISGLIENGIFIGMSSLDGYIDHHTFTCRVPSVVASMPSERLSQWDNDMLFSLVLMQTKKVRTIGNQLINQYLEPTQVRIARLLLELGGVPKEVGGHEIPLIVNVNKQDVADFIGTTREHCSKVMGEMQKGQLITLKGKNIVFYPSKLKQLMKTAE